MGPLTFKGRYFFPPLLLFLVSQYSQEINRSFVLISITFHQRQTNKLNFPFWVIASCVLLKRNFGSKINFGVIPVSGVLFISWEKSSEQNGLLVSWGETLSSLPWASDLPNDLLLAQLDVRQAHLSLCWPFTPPAQEVHQSLPPNCLPTRQQSLMGAKDFLSMIQSSYKFLLMRVPLNLLWLHNFHCVNAMLPYTLYSYLPSKGMS